jgi:hypothetical protein
MQRGKTASYSITSSAMASSVGGILRPMSFAVCRLTINSNLVSLEERRQIRLGYCIGRSAI